MKTVLKSKSWKTEMNTLPKDSFRGVAICTQQLVTILGETFKFDKPILSGVAARSTSTFSAIVVDVIKLKEGLFGLTTAGAHAAISVKQFLTQRTSSAAGTNYTRGVLTLAVFRVSLPKMPRVSSVSSPARCTSAATMGVGR